LLLLALASLLAAAFTVWHTRAKLHRLVDALLAGIEALQSGMLAHRIEAGADAELARLACGFNAMAGELLRHRRAAEAARVELEQAVNASSAELRSAHDTLQLAERRQCQFLEDISHELRTPATAIRGEAEIVLHGPEKPVHEYRLALQRIVASVQQMGVLIDDVLLLARVEADPYMLHRVATPWIDALSEAANLAEALGHAQQIEIRFDAEGEGKVASGDPLLAHADPDRLRQALFVVLDNAVRYSRPQGVVTVSWSARDDSLCAIVRDRGIGIDAAELPKLFVRHARGARARAHRADGSGLGLAIAHAIVHAHDGQITIESLPAAGTTVRMSIPRCRAQALELA
jgi:signal transduction histidine kinase